MDYEKNLSAAMARLQLNDTASREPSPDRDRSASHLLRMPPELVQNILTYLPATDVAQNVDLTCWHLRGLTPPVYHTLYGKTPTPEKVTQPADWKRAACQQAVMREGLAEIIAEASEEDTDTEVPTLEEAMGSVLEDFYWRSDEGLYGNAKLALLIASDAPNHETSAWLTAVVIALLLQGRRDTAEPYLAKLEALGGLPQETAALLKARLDLDLPVAWSECSDALRARCVRAAATGNHVQILQELRASGVDLAARIDTHYTAATVAAINGQTDVLKYLHSEGVDVVNAFRRENGNLGPVPESPLYEAAKQNHVDAARFLLSVGAQPDAAGDAQNASGPSAFDIALQFGCVDVLRLFREHTPSLVQTFTPSGALRLERCVLDRANRGIAYLVDEGGIDVNAVDAQGRTALHIAAGGSKFFWGGSSIEALLAHGANPDATDALGRTALDIAQSQGLAYAVEVLRGETSEDLAARKLALAKEIIAACRDQTLDLAVNGEYGDRIPGNTPEEKRAYVAAGLEAEGIEDRTAAIWAKYFGLSTLQGLKDMLGTARQAAVAKMPGFLATAAKTGGEDVESTAAELPLVPLAEEVVQSMFTIVGSDPSLCSKVARYTVRHLPEAELMDLVEHVRSPLGVAVRRANQSKETEEMFLMGGFILKLVR